MVKKYYMIYSVNGVNVPLANVLFAYWTGTQWDPLNGWIESFNSSAATVWVRLDRQILPYNTLTIYMLFVNDTTLGTTSWGVNSYYTQNLSLDNIGYVMQGGVLYQVYIDANGSLYNSGGGKAEALERPFRSLAIIYGIKVIVTTLWWASRTAA